MAALNNQRHSQITATLNNHESSTFTNNHLHFKDRIRSQLIIVKLF